MRIELVTGASNIVRFPVERRARPTLALLRTITPDPLEVTRIVESFAFKPLPTPLRDPEGVSGGRSAGELKAVLARRVETAIGACRAAHDAAVASTTAQERVVAAQSAGADWGELASHADKLTTIAAELLVAAFVRSEKAESAATALDRMKNADASRAMFG